MTKIFMKLAEKLNPIARPLGVVMVLLFILTVPRLTSQGKFKNRTSLDDTGILVLMLLVDMVSLLPEKRDDKRRVQANQ